ncbi:hypothetical protein WAF17_17700 [Bernardetia sp. ABR2-2B]|uniref:hypothetical protein n=1 Tax=Bernardetia sp. ABR2-2B TaxID=3127472 RepID=UPI0030CBB5E3
MKLIYENIEQEGDASYQIYINHKEKSFYIKASGNISESFHTITNLQLLEEIGKHKYSRFIFDLSEQTSTELKSRVWFVSHVTQKAYSILRGKKIYAAAISSANPMETAFTHIIVRSITHFNQKINIQLFNSDAMESAKKWILKDQVEDIRLAS